MGLGGEGGEGGRGDGGGGDGGSAQAGLGTKTAPQGAGGKKLTLVGEVQLGANWLMPLGAFRNGACGWTQPAVPLQFGGAVYRKPEEQTKAGSLVWFQGRDVLTGIAGSRLLKKAVPNQLQGIDDPAGPARPVGYVCVAALNQNPLEIEAWDFIFAKKRAFERLSEKKILRHKFIKNKS